MVGSLVIVLLHVFSWFWQWNNFENRLIFDEVKGEGVQKTVPFWATLYSREDQGFGLRRRNVLLPSGNHFLLTPLHPAELKAVEEKKQTDVDDPTKLLNLHCSRLVWEVNFSRRQSVALTHCRSSFLHRSQRSQWCSHAPFISIHFLVHALRRRHRSRARFAAALRHVIASLPFHAAVDFNQLPIDIHVRIIFIFHRRKLCQGRRTAQVAPSRGWHRQLLPRVTPTIVTPVTLLTIDRQTGTVSWLEVDDRTSNYFFLGAKP